MHKPVKYLVLIDAAGAPVARMFDADMVHILDIDATSEEVVDMTGGHVPAYNAAESQWESMLAGHTLEERKSAQIFTLDI
ncbi:hypothetical protein BH09PSE5_BH09PSE5_16720 [soil metagenome]